MSTAGIITGISTLVLVGSTLDMDSVGAAREAATEIFNIIEKTPTADDTGTVPDNISYDIRLRNVHFSYPSRLDLTVLSGLTLDIEPGQTVALVGASGSGKSTIIQLLQRFYDIQSGEILIGGHDIRELNLQWLRQSIGVVSQEPVLFGGTIAENISYGKEDATQEEIEMAAKAVNAHSFITELPDGYNTLVGERGTQLSGGQKQRMAIARAIIRDPMILLLDEATSALDTESEAIVQDALNKASVGRTTIVIAHRLSTIKHVDLIAVMDEGRIVEFDTLKELIAQQGSFFKLMAAQLHIESCMSASDDNLTVKTKRPEDYCAPKLSFNFFDMTDDELEEEMDNREMLSIIKMSKWYYLLMAVIGSLVEGLAFCFVCYFYTIFVIQAYLDPNTAEQNARLALVVYPILAIFLAITLFTKTASYGNNGAILISRLRKSSLQAMLKQEISWFDLKYNWTGALVSRLAIDASLVENLLGTQLGIMLSSAVTFTAITVLAYIYLDSSAASLVMTALLPLATVPVIIRAMMSVDSTKESGAILEESNHMMFESILSIRTVVSFSLQKKLMQVYTNALTPYKSGIKKSSIMFGALYGAVEVSQFIITAIMIRFGAFLVSVPDEHKFHTTFINVLVPTLTTLYATTVGKQLGHSMSKYFNAKIAVKSVFSLLYRKSMIDPSSTRGIFPDHIRGEISFSRVAFSYPTRQEASIFKSISFSVLPGETLAIVGPSGCGKSTVTALIERFYDPSSGAVRLDGIDLRLLNIQWLHGQIGLVSQEPALFDATIADNIRYGANFREVTDEEVEMVAKSANIHYFIMGLPQGYDTKVGPKGSHLSGGQKQRVAIARALVRDPKILLLDEATSALDAENEKLVEEALEKAQKGRTCIKIAHRLSTVYNADKIIVISDGRVIESGTHTELMLQNGLYCKMNNLFQS
ncbi:ATP-dependent translocase ABCB1-like [Dysidea avara]|uniref:ATP-dependent translocase ABCB1-like n=1 Tax=Dysidea avara TaxID=196820 RepID=UPI0033291204